MNQVPISVEENLSNEERQFIVNGLDAYNDAQTPDPNYRELIVMSRH